MRCSRCGSDVKEGEGMNLQDKIVCEDCYMDATNPPKACDPTAVASALSVRKQLGQSGAEGLTEQQKNIYRIIEKKGRVTKEELAKLIGIKVEELEREFAVLRHCELVRAYKEGSNVYLSKW